MARRTDGTAEIHYSPTYHPSALNAKNATRVQVQAGGGPTGVEIRLVSTPILRVSGRVSGFSPGAQNVGVSLSPNSYTSGNGGQVRADGSFEIWRVDPGKYTLRASYYNFGRQLTSAPMEVEIGDSDLENLALQLVAPADVRGAVEFEDDDARKFVQRQALPAQQTGPNGQQQQAQPPYLVLREASLNATASGEIQQDGSFTLSQVRPGIYRATINRGRLYVKAMEFGQVHVASSQLDLRSGAAGEALTLHVASATGTIGGVVRDEKGPAGGLLVAIVEAEAQRPNPLITAKTQEDGSYQMIGVAPGKYRIVAYQEGDLVWVNEDLEDIGEPIEVRDHETLTKDLKSAR